MHISTVSGRPAPQRDFQHLLRQGAGRDRVVTAKAPTRSSPRRRWSGLAPIVSLPQTPDELPPASAWPAPPPGAQDWRPRLQDLRPSPTDDRHVYKTYPLEFGKRADAMAAAVSGFGPTDLELSILLAVGSIETENFGIDYVKGDGKIGDAYNVSPYKMNRWQVRLLDKTLAPETVHKDLVVATRLMLTGLRRFGPDWFLVHHRGGQGATVEIPWPEITVYVTAIYRLAAIYRSHYPILPPDRFRNLRRTIAVPDI